MALFEDKSKSKEEFDFPTEPAFLVPIEIKPIPTIGDDHYGVFAKEFIPSQTKFWVWTDRVKVIPHEDLKQYINDNFGTTKSEIQIFLRQGFVLPPSTTTTTTTTSEEKEEDGTTTTTTKTTTHGNEDQYFYTNPTDAGRFMNHNSKPNCGPDGTLRDIYPGDEMTMDYSFHGNPKWYQDICNEYDVLTERQVAEKYTSLSFLKLS